MGSMGGWKTWNHYRFLGQQRERYFINAIQEYGATFLPEVAAE